MEGYWCYWHGDRGYSGVALHVRKSFSPVRPVFSHPSFDYERRIVAVDLGKSFGIAAVMQSAPINTKTVCKIHSASPSPDSEHH